MCVTRAVSRERGVVLERTRFGRATMVSLNEVKNSPALLPSSRECLFLNQRRVECLRVDICADPESHERPEQASSVADSRSSRRWNSWNTHGMNQKTSQYRGREIRGRVLARKRWVSHLKLETDLFRKLWNNAACVDPSLVSPLWIKKPKNINE